MSQHQSLPIERLKGRENFDTWKFAVQAYLEDLELWECITETDPDKKKDTKCRSKLILLIEPVNYVHIQNTTTAKQAWENLSRAFQDDGLTRRVGLLRTLITTKLEDCSSVEEYVNRIITTAHKLTSVGLMVSDEWVGTILLAGLPNRFEPMIMGIESSGTAVTADAVKTKLLQDLSIVKSRSENIYDDSNSAFYGRSSEGVSVQSKEIQKYRNYEQGKPDKYPSRGPRCFKCNGYGHIAKNCSSPATKMSVNKSNKAAGTSLFAAFSAQLSDKNEFFLDSGASCHLCRNLEMLTNVRKTEKISITAANKERMTSDTVGDISLSVTTSGNNPSEVNVNNVYYVPDLEINLLSVSQIVSKGHRVVFNSNGAKIFNSQRKLIASASLVNSLFKLDVPTRTTFALSTKCDMTLWHRRMAHLNYDSLCKLGTISNAFNPSGQKPSTVCDICMLGKSHRLPFPKSDTTTEQCLQLVHSDLVGPMEVGSLAGSRYLLTFLDDFSHKSFVYFLKSKDQVTDYFRIFKSLVENQSGKKIKILRTDNGGEYCNKKLSNFLKSSGIVHQTSCPYSPQQNGKAERLNRSLLDRARCLLIESGLPTVFWAEAVNCATYLLNRSPCKSVDTTPEHVWTAKKIALQHLRIFGCKAYAHIPAAKRTKLNPRSSPCIFVGYCEDTKGYRLYDPKKKITFISRDVTFSEYQWGNSLLRNIPDGTDRNFYVLPNESNFENSYSSEDNDTTESRPLIDDDSPNSEVQSENDDDPDFVPSTTITLTEQSTSTRPERERRPPTKLRDFVTYSAFSTGFELSDPMSYEDALLREDKPLWVDAMKRELKAQMNNRTWELVELPASKRALPCKWVFRTKRDASGTITGHKARLVAKGFAQRRGVDYEETFSPVVRYSSIRYLISLAAEYNLDIHQMDAVSAFLQGDLEEEIYMSQPPGFSDGTSKVCRLRKSLYGLKQASRVWNEKLDSILQGFGLTQSKFDSCVYYKIEEQCMIIVAVWVDDLLIFANNRKMMNEVKCQLSRSFEMTDLGEAKSFLGLELTRDRKSKKIWLSQQHYIEQILKRFNMDEANPVSTPMSNGDNFSKTQEPRTEGEKEKMRKIPYQEAIGSLLFAAQITRPDIAFAVSSLSRFNNNPGMPHWAGVKRVLRYLRGTSSYKLKFDGSKIGPIYGYCDADWASDPDERRSVTGYIFIKCDAPISWCTKRQPTVALSTTEAEYMSMSSAAQEALWLRGLSEEIEQHSKSPTEIFCDNQGARNLALNGAYQARTKHIDVRHHFMREKVHAKLLAFTYVPTKKMIADSLTKALDVNKFSECIKYQGICK